MQVSKKDISKKLEKTLSELLYDLVVESRSYDDAAVLLKTILSDTERVAIMKRVGIAVYLSKHKSYELIASELQVSSATIAAVQERLATPEWKKILERMTISIEAEELSTKLTSIFSSIFKAKK